MRSRRSMWSMRSRRRSKSGRRRTRSRRNRSSMRSRRNRSSMRSRRNRRCRSKTCHMELENKAWETKTIICLERARINTNDKKRS